MRLSLKILWTIVAIVLLTIVIVLSLWEIPISQTNIQKDIPIDHFIKNQNR